MDKDLSTTYAGLSALFGAIVGVEIGVFWCALAGAFLSLRFIETKETKKQILHVIYSVLLACIIVGGTSNILIEGKLNSIYPNWLSLKVVGLAYGFVILLLAEKTYAAIRDTNFTAKINTVIDKVIDKWTT